MLSRRDVVIQITTLALLPYSAIQKALERKVPTRKTMQIKVSKNNRFLAHQDETPFFYLGDTAWELFHRLDREQADAYLSLRAKQGFTVIQAAVLAELDGLHIPNPYGQLPLLNADPTKPNEDYFRHVDFIVNRAQALGLTIGMLPTWGDKWNKKWGVGPEIFTPEYARVYGQWLAKRYADKPIIWILGGDRPAETDDHRAIINSMAEGIRASVGHTQLITYHTWGQHSSADYFPDAAWMDFHTCQTGHQRDFENWGYISTLYNRTPVKPCMDAEPGYENMPNHLKDPEVRLTAYDCRKFLYWALFAGAHGHTYGCNDVWQMWSKDKQSTIWADTAWDQAIHLPGSGQMHFAKDLLLARPFFARIPDQTLIVSGAHSGAEYIAATRDEEGRYALVYSAAGLPFKLNLNKLKGPLRVAWFDPRTGQSLPQGIIDAAGEHEFQPPVKGDALDWVLTLDQER